MADANPRVGIREIRQHASRYVELAAEGTTIDVTNRGRVVARLVPAAAAEDPAVADLVAAGVVRPPDDEGDVLDIEPVPSTGPVPPSEALRRMRDEER
ncbi:MAG TPA: type II toxin-antitoxin system prevent-host-death family antitoxin [Acidimicrobiales bacterium]|nr:type II toxin-antitoxin system prevent-host-death family antitoxin [Acidimicrobiales bacterium]